MGKHLTLVLGGARSGKSTYAQNLIESTGQAALFVATAAAGDEEMAARIVAHRASRPSNWVTLEAPLEVGKAIRSTTAAPWVLLDCMTLLTSNVLLSCPEPVQEREFRDKLKIEIEDLIASYQVHSGEWVIVSNEVGLGLVPPYQLGRLYRDGIGWANQRMAQTADRVVFMVAGIPMNIK